MNTTLAKWLKNDFAKHQTHLEFQCFIYKNLQTDSGRETYNFGSFRANRAGICWQTTPADDTTTEVISQRYSQLTSLTSLGGLLKVPENASLVSMDVASFYTNIPQEEGIQTVSEAYDTF